MMAIKYTVTHEIVEDLIAKVRRTLLDQINHTKMHSSYRFDILELAP